MTSGPQMPMHEPEVLTAPAIQGGHTWDVNPHGQHRKSFYRRVDRNGVIVARATEVQSAGSYNTYEWNALGHNYIDRDSALKAIEVMYPG